MLRVIVLLLIVMNGLFFAWGEGAMPGFGPRPAEIGREPQRWTRQLRPDAVQLMSGNGPASAATAPEASAAVSGLPEAAASVSPSKSEALLASAAAVPPEALAAASGPLACLEAGPFGAMEIASVEKALGSVAKSDAWTIKPINSAGVWLVYLGTFNAPDALDQKKAALRRASVRFEEVRSPSDLAPGLSLGRFSDAGRAQERANELSAQGVSGVRVVSAAAPRTLYTVRLPQVSGDLQNSVLRLNGDPLMGKNFVPCAGG
jgi:hypothetical protein